MAYRRGNTARCRLSRGRVFRSKQVMHSPRRILGLPPELTKPPAPKRCPAASQGRCPPCASRQVAAFEAAFLSVLPGAQNVSTESLYNEDCRRVIPIR